MDIICMHGKGPRLSRLGGSAAGGYTFDSASNEATWRRAANQQIITNSLCRLPVTGFRNEHGRARALSGK